VEVEDVDEVEVEVDELVDEDVEVVDGSSVLVVDAGIVLDDVDDDVLVVVGTSREYVTTSCGRRAGSALSPAE
jgi:hypothetical protein